MKLIHLSWQEIQRLTEELAEKIKDSGFNPDIIVAISRGGFDPARILCDQLLIKRLASLQVEFYKGVNEVLDEPEIVIPVNTDLNGYKVLLVDDVADSGDSLNVAKKHLIEKRAGEIKIATLHCKPWSKPKPDYFVKTVEQWIVYPWEQKETLLGIAETLKKDGLTGSEVIKRLRDMGFKQRYIRKYLIFK